MNNAEISKINAVLFEFSALVKHLDATLYERQRINISDDNSDNTAFKIVNTYFVTYRAWCSTHNETDLMRRMDTLIKKHNR